MKSPIRVILVDDHPVVREGLKRALQEEKAIRIVGEADSLERGESVLHQKKPDVMILDVRLNDLCSISLLQKAKAALPDTRVLVLSIWADASTVRKYFAARADGYLLKDSPVSAIVDAIVSVREGRRVWDERITEALAESLNDDKPLPDVSIEHLNYQEKRIVERVTKGLTNRQIGAELKLSDKTVRNYLSRIMDKLGVKRRAEVAALYTSASMNGGF